MISTFGPSTKDVTNHLPDGSELEVRVTTQGGKTTIAKLRPTSGSFNRTIDSTSNASVTMVTNWDANNLTSRDRARKLEECEELRNVCIGKQELEFRFGKDVFWAGPIQYVSWANDTVTIEAEDNTSWWAARVLPRINLSTARDLTEIVEIYHQSAMDINPVDGFDLITSKSGQFADTIVTVDDKRTALDAIDEIAEFGVDYTAIGRKVMVGPPSAFPTLPDVFSDDYFSSGLKVEKLGPRQGFATRIIAFGESGRPVTVQADAATLATYGVIERVVEFVQLTSVEDLTLAAQAYLKTFANPWYVASENGAVLKPGLPISVNTLLPGAKVNVNISASCNPVQQLLRIREVGYDIASGTIHPFA